MNYSKIWHDLRILKEALNRELELITNAMNAISVLEKENLELKSKNYLNTTKVLNQGDDK